MGVSMILHTDWRNQTRGIGEGVQYSPWLIQVLDLGLDFRKERAEGLFPTCGKRNREAFIRWVKRLRDETVA